MFKYWMMPLITAMLLSFSSTTLWAAGDYAPDQTQQAVTPRSKKETRDQRRMDKSSRKKNSRQRTLAMTVPRNGISSLG